MESYLSNTAAANQAMTSTGPDGIVIPVLHYNTQKGHKDRNNNNGTANVDNNVTTTTTKDVSISLFDPLDPAYKSSYTEPKTEVEMSQTTDVFFPPGFINS